MAYPATNTPIPAYAGTALQGDINHAGWHGITNTDLDGIKTTLGTTAGTSVLKNMSAGDFVPTQAVASDVNTGTATLLYVSPKALKDSHNVPVVAPGTSGNIMKSNGTDWTSGTPASSLSVTTKGDLQTFNSTVPDRLPVGTDGQVLTASSSLSLGVGWAAAAGGSGSVTTAKTSVTQTSNATATYADITASSQSVVVTKTSNVMINAAIQVQNNTNTNPITIRVLRDSTTVYEHTIMIFNAGNGYWNTSSFTEKDVPAGTYTYKLQLKNGDNSTTVYVLAASNYIVTQLS